MPVIYSVDADGPAARGGVRGGDLLAQVDGVAITTIDGGRRFGAVKPGNTMRWKVFRENAPHTFTVVAGKHPDRPRAYSEAARARARLRESLETLRQEEQELRRDARSLERADELRALQDAQRELARALRELDRARARHGPSLLTPAPTAPVAPVAPVAPTAADVQIAPITPRPGSRQHLRYRGEVGGSNVEVRGTGAVAVTEGKNDGEVVITTPDATIRIRKSK